ncbi:carboxymuconolactone decarboxylase family protein [Sphingomonas hankyongi]|uniref:Carboxymuconolactone decarboxylase family protein n=1 Tax=Sphingomonas hankyongi TaxID=2908209 RepID=A0ABT0S1L8_9SPHN|nr:carboxymuconolactone decarboxylase family protein [Sphingomonas hankyongi]MCL6729765.1 carboxymuconolactone decarboxylase family protein [Sphingomonas hankyongi]
MSRIPAIDLDQAPASARPILSVVQASLGAIPNLFRVTANSPAALDALVGAIGALSKGTIDAPAREAIALTVAEANNCDYCVSAHAVLGTGAGLSEMAIEDARRGYADDPKVSAMLAFARSLVSNRGRVTNSDVERLRGAGLADGEIVEVVANVALNIFTNYLNGAADTEIDFPVVRVGLPIAA